MAAVKVDRKNFGTNQSSEIVPRLKGGGGGGLNFIRVRLIWLKAERLHIERLHIAYWIPQGSQPLAGD
jgi:hypothetical protein